MRRTLMAVSLAGPLMLAGGAIGQPAPATGPGPAPAPAAVDATPANDQAAQDRIMALVRAGKCGPAKAEATRVGDASLAEQIGAMCGARSSNPFPEKRSGGGSRGGRPGGGG